MLGSIPTAADGKAGPTNWLDRLRSSKGFPTGPPNHGLDHFLLTHNLLSNSTRSHDTRVPTNTDVSVSAKAGDAIADILSDLFNMGDDPHAELRRSSAKKTGRKQPNPRFCFVSAAATTSNDMGENCSDYGVRNDDNVLAKALSLSNSDNHSNNCGDDDDEREEDETDIGGSNGGDVGDRELKGYSRSEVTVIDTSFEVWKFDKLVFRRKNVWKVRDKKGKSWVGRTKKKRKGSDFEFRSGNVGAKKKAKLSKDKMQDEKREGVSTKTLDALSQVPKKRFHFSKSLRKLEKSGSSAVLIKAVPTSKKSGRTLPNNHHGNT